jgi:hypothetical protein
MAMKTIVAKLVTKSPFGIEFITLNAGMDVLSQSNLDI